MEAQEYMTEYDKGRGIEVVSWCTSSGARSSLNELLGKGSECRSALVRHGNKSQNELGLSAIKEICLGNYDNAKDLIRACDCHNPGDFQSVWNDWEKVVAWANQHPYCAQWQEWIDEANACRSAGNQWDNDRRICIDAVLPEPLSPTFSFFVSTEIVCRSESGSIMRMYPQFGSDESCSDASTKASTFVQEKDRCSEQANYWRMFDWKYVDTATCRK
jgi:hypothetical protein